MTGHDRAASIFPKDWFPNDSVSIQHYISKLPATEESFMLMVNSRRDGKKKPNWF